LGLVTFAAGTGNAAPADSTFAWSSPNYVPGVGTSAAPSMAQCGQTAYLVWKGVSTDEHLYYTSYSSAGGWAAQQQIVLGNLTDTAPSVSCDSYPLGGSLMLVAWKGIGTDQHVYTTSESAGAGPNAWSAPQQVAGALTDVSPAAGMVPTDYIIPASKTAKPAFTIPQVQRDLRGERAAAAHGEHWLRRAGTPVQHDVAELESVLGGELAHRVDAVLAAGDVQLEITRYVRHRATISW
jgi:hypothetical protein